MCMQHSLGPGRAGCIPQDTGLSAQGSTDADADAGHRRLVLVPRCMFAPIMYMCVHLHRHNGLLHPGYSLHACTMLQVLARQVPFSWLQ